MSSAESQTTFRRASRIIRNRGLQGLVVTGIGTIILTWINGLAKTIEAVFDFFADPFGAIGEGIGGLIASLFGGSSLIVDVGAVTTASNLQIFNFLAFPVAIGVGVSVAAIILSRTVQLETTGNSLTTLFTGIDLPDFVPFGSAEEEEDG